MICGAGIGARIFYTAKFHFALSEVKLRDTFSAQSVNPRSNPAPQIILKNIKTQQAIKHPAFPWPLGILLFAVAALCSSGYHHPDEHFQIIEFAHYKLAGTPLRELPWEFHNRIRPGLQPLLAAAFFQACRAAGLSDPFWQIALLRLGTGLLALFVFAKMVRQLRAGFSEPDTHVWLAAALVGLWFMPYLSVRFSSENLAGLAFLAGIFCLLRLPAGRQTAWMLVAGLAFGLSFCFRFQMAFAVVGVMAWLVWVRKMPFSNLPALAAGGLAALGVGALTDRWLYGAWVCPPYNYFAANILENKAASWGTAPVWFYPLEFVGQAAPPISLLLLGLAGAGFWRQRRHVLAWGFAVFLLAHSMVGHKEMRFMFPMLLPFLFFAASGWEVWQGILTDQKWRRTALWVCLAANCILLIFRCLMPAHESVAYLRYLYRRAEASAEGSITVFAEKSAPHKAVGLPMNFYRHPKVEFRVVQRFVRLRRKSDELPPKFLYVSQKLVLQDSLPGYGQRRAYTFFPDWVLYLNVNDWQSRSRVYSVYEFGELGVGD